MLPPVALFAVLAAQGGMQVETPAAPAPLEVQEADVRARIGLATEYDSNAKRLPTQASPPDDAPGDGLMRFSADASGGLRTGDTYWSWSGALGGKLFFDQRSERTLVGQGRIGALFPMGGGWRGQLSGFTKARSQISGVRTYAVTRGDFFASRGFGSAWLGRGGLYGTTFQSGDAPLFSSTTGGAQLGVSWFLTQREVLDLGVDGQLRAFPFLVPAPQPGRPSLDVSRVDVPVVARIGLRSSRALYLDLSYALTRNLSNSRGEAYTRHRLAGTIGVRLPADVTGTLRGTLQLAQYDDGLSVGQQIFLNVNDESQNSLQISLTRPWIGGLSLEARLAIYGNELADQELNFQRTTASVGLRSEL